MIRLWRRLLSKFRRPSAQTLEAQRRLHAVEADDCRIDDIICQHRDVLRSNHLGPLIADLFEKRPPPR